MAFKTRSIKPDSDRIREAVELFSAGYNCAQAILAAYGSGIDRDTAFRLGAPFGGGLADSGNICGAVTGGLMAIGLAFGEPAPPRMLAKRRLYGKSRLFMDRFAESLGSLDCTSIRKDISQSSESVSGRQLCASVVESAARILEDII